MFGCTLPKGINYAKCNKIPMYPTLGVVPSSMTGSVHAILNFAPKDVL